MPMTPHAGESQTRIDIARLRELLEYEPATGVIRWRVGRPGRGARRGAVAGTINSKGYRQICVERRLYLASHIAFALMTGRWPESLIDHKDLNQGDDRWENLRPANYSENGANSRAKNGVARLKGVTWVKSRNRYAARIKVNYRTINLGWFSTAEGAHAAYSEAARAHFGEFARAG